jgi:hypothetical protein
VLSPRATARFPDPSTLRVFWPSRYRFRANRGRTVPRPPRSDWRDRSKLEDFVLQNVSVITVGPGLALPAYLGALLALKIQHKSIVILLSVPCPEGARHISPGQRPGCGIIRSLALKGRNISLWIQFLLTPIAKSLSLLCRTYSARIFFSLTRGVAGGRLCPGLICVAPSGLLIGFFHWL